MSEAKATNMICPKCGKFQEKADACKSCGVVIVKARGDDAVAPQPKEAVPPKTDSFTRFTHESTSIAGPKQRLVIPMIILGAVLIGIGVTMLANKLSGGSLNYGIMRHLGWAIIPVAILIGGSCIAQAFEWKSNND